MTRGLAASVDDAHGAPPPVVGIGASAGGVEAFRGFFEAMPPDSGMAFVVVLHLPPDARSQLPEILGRWTSMRVVAAEEGCLVEANCVYVPPAGVMVTFADGRLHPHRPSATAPRPPKPIDLLFDSLATALGDAAVGVVLSGTGSDGALGLKAIKARGGLTLAQGEDGSSPQHDGMPASAIASGGVDIVASVEVMPAHIVSVHAARQAPGDGVELTHAQMDAQTDAARLAICDVLHQQLGHDFRGYKKKTFLRRVLRRLQALGLEALPHYVARLDGDPAEVGALFRDLLIGVTSFFRDAGTFDALRRVALPLLFEGRGPASTLRCWVPGCATGEEAYSLAMLLRECADALGEAAPRLQVFATDIDEPAVATARQGRYVSTLLQGVSPERLARFFVDNGDGSHTVARSVREICTFSAHSLTRDPPFSRIDLVSCRNLLIYLDAELQAVVMPAFHYSLAPGGILLLGSSEGVSRHEDLFATLDRGHRIFQRRPGRGPPPLLAGRSDGRDLLAATGASPSRATGQAGAAGMHGRAKARILDRFAPAFVVVAADGEIVQYSSRVGRFLEPAAGAPAQNVLAMVRGGLRAPLAEALRQASETKRPVETPGLAPGLAGEGAQHVTLAVEPLTEPGSDPLYLVVFIATGQRADEPPARAHDAGPLTGHARRVEGELRDTRERLRSMTEEHEAALEELRGANEELRSANEELRSANEELETSKGEIQSVNEELRTVNHQLAGKVAELDGRNSDLRNLFDSAEVATIFLDPDLMVRSFTPAAAGIYDLIPGDVGRRLTDIASRLRYDGLRADVGQALASLGPLERRVARDDGSAHYLMRVLPYRTPDRAVSGTLVTFVDVTGIVLAERHQKLLVEELDHRVKDMLTVVSSLASQTTRRARTMAELSESYMGRIHALTAACSLLGSEGWRTVPLREVVMAHLEPFLAGDRGNVVLAGPPVPLQPRAALLLGIAVHELVTNAVKYGALSVPEGNVRVLWRVDAEADGGCLVLDWIERDGPAVIAPTRRGFGLALIERGLRQDMAAEVTVDFGPEGVTAGVRAPLSPRS